MGKLVASVGRGRYQWKGKKGNPVRGYQQNSLGDTGHTHPDKWAIHLQTYGGYPFGDMGYTCAETWESPVRRHG